MPVGFIVLMGFMVVGGIGVIYFFLEDTIKK